MLPLPVMRVFAIVVAATCVSPYARPPKCGMSDDRPLNCEQTVGSTAEATFTSVSHAPGGCSMQDCCAVLARFSIDPLIEAGTRASGLAAEFVPRELSGTLHTSPPSPPPRA